MFRYLLALMVVIQIVTSGCGDGGSFNGRGSFNPPPPTTVGEFSTTGTPSFDHGFGAAVRLANGNVLVTGGSPSQASAEIYDPSTAQFHSISNLIEGRTYHTATLLNDGRVLIAGGGTSSLRSAELYDPGTGNFSAVGPMNFEHSQHTAVLLSDGSVLVAGGNVDGKVELFDPNSNTFTSVGAMHFGRWGHTAVKLPNNRVLVVGGYFQTINAPEVTGTTEIYDPATKSFSDSSNLRNARANHGATLLPNGKVLVVGGETNTNEFIATSELFDTGGFTQGPTMILPQSRATISPLPSGRVLIAGGYDQLTICQNFDPCPQATSAAEVYDPTTNSFLGAGNMSTPRAGHGAVLLENGEILLEGGTSDASEVSAERYAE